MLKDYIFTGLHNAESVSVTARSETCLVQQQLNTGYIGAKMQLNSTERIGGRRLGVIDRNASLIERPRDILQERCNSLEFP